MSGEHIDLSSDPKATSTAHGVDHAGLPTGKKRFLGVHFQCCDVYTRIYVNRDETAYVGNCPKCAKQLRIAIGSGGTSARFFRAS